MKDYRSNSALSGQRLHWLIGLLVALSLWALPTIAEAHAHLISSTLVADQVLSSAPHTALFWFDEDINTALSSVVIVTSQGKQVNTDTGHAVPGNARALAVTLPTLPAGRYTVQWTSDSATDGHVLHGFYLFGVGMGTTLNGTAGSGGAVINAATPMTLEWAALPQILSRWGMLLGLALWSGLLVLWFMLQTRAAPAAIAWLLEPVLAACRRWRLPAIALLTLSTVAEMVVQAVNVVSGNSGRLLTPALWQSLLLDSRYGLLWMGRLGVIGLIATIALARAQPSRTAQLSSQMVAMAMAVPLPVGSPPRSEAARMWAQVGLTALLLALVALSGHAATVAHSVPQSIIMDWLHLIATSIWFGGILALALVVPRRLHAGKGQRTAEGVLWLWGRFSPFAIASVAVLGVSGIVDATLRLSSWQELATTLYGQALIVKSALVGLMIAISASHAVFLRPRLRAALPSTPMARISALEQRIRSLTLLEAALGTLVLLCVGIMSATVPPASQPAAATPAPPRALTASQPLGTLTVTLRVAPPTLGHDLFTVSLRQGGQPLGEAQVLLHVQMPAMANMGMTALDTTAGSAGQFSASTDIVQAGQWRIDALVRTPSDPLNFHTVSFQLTTGFYGQLPTLGAWPARSQVPPSLPAHAGVAERAAHTYAVHIGPYSGSLSISPATTGPNMFAITLYTAHGLAPAATTLSLSLDSLDMHMGTTVLVAHATASGHYIGMGAFSMGGNWQVGIGLGTLHTALRVQVSDIASAPVAMPPTHRTTSAYASPRFNVALPYNAFVTRMTSNTLSWLNHGTVAAGTTPHGLDFVIGKPFVYVTDMGSNDVRVINLSTGRLAARITVGLSPAHVVFTPNGREAYVSNLLSGDVSIIDVAHNREITRLTVGLYPHGIDVTPNGRAVYVACINSGGVWVIDTRTHRVSATIPTGLQPYGVTADPNGAFVYVTDATLNQVDILSTATHQVVARVPVGAAPALMVETPARQLYVANYSGGTVSVIDLARRAVIATVPVSAGPHGLDVTPDGKYVYVASNDSGNVTVVRTSDNRVVATLHLGGRPNEVAILQKGDVL